MTDQDYKAEITGPYNSFFSKYQIEYFVYLNGLWYKQFLFDNTFGSARTFEKAEKLAQQTIQRWRNYDQAKANKTTIT